MKGGAMLTIVQVAALVGLVVGAVLVAGGGGALVAVSAIALMVANELEEGGP